MQFVVSRKQGPHGLLVVVTDADILGKVFEEGKVQLDLSREFYTGERMGKEEVKTLLPGAQHLHFTGKNAVALAVEMNLVDSRRILWVKGVPHAQAVEG